MTKLILRMEIGAAARLGPGKVELLETIARTHSISGAGREMGMSYRRAWLLVDSLNRVFQQPVVATRLGGRAAGRAHLTPFGEELVARYRRMEGVARTALAADLAVLEAELDETVSAPIRRDPKPTAG